MFKLCNNPRLNELGQSIISGLQWLSDNTPEDDMEEVEDVIRNLDSDLWDLIDKMENWDERFAALSASIARHPSTAKE